MDTVFYQGLLNTLMDGVYFVDRKRRITFWNKAAERISGYSSDEVMGKPCAVNILSHVDADGNKICKSGCPLTKTMVDGDVHEMHVFMHHKLGHRLPVFVRSSPMYNELKELIGAVEVFVDSTETNNRLQELETLRQEILTDPLTQLGNRRFAEVTMERLDEAMQHNDIRYGVLVLDVDFFKKVNDTYGHPVGDEVLKMVAKTIQSTVRPLDAACRWGGEEFVVLVPNTTVQGLMGLAERLRIMMENAWIMHAEEKLSVTISVGGSVAEFGDKAVDVIARADEQVYVSKSSGRNCVHIAPMKMMPS